MFLVFRRKTGDIHVVVEDARQQPFAYQLLVFMHDGPDVGQLRVQIIECGADQRKFILPDSGNLRVGIDPDFLHDRIHRAQHNHAVNHRSGEIGRSHGQIDDKPLQERGAYCGEEVHP